MGKLTDKALRDAKARDRAYRLTGAGHYGHGRLICQIAPSGTKTFFFRYRAQGADRLIKVGPYDPEGRPGYFTLKKATDEARRLGDRLQRTPDLKEAIELEKHAEQKERRAKLMEAKAAKAKSLRALLAVYVAHLRRLGKPSANDAEGIFARHVVEAYPELADQPASSLDAEAFAEILRRLIERGKSRTAGKLRSYVAAAYNLALRAATDPTAPADALGFRLPANPAAATKAHSGVQARARVLSAAELRQFMDAMDGVSELQRDAFALLLLLGGQRPAQLMRATVSDADLPGRTLTLYDSKGKRAKPRTHVLPLSDAAAEIVRRRLDAAEALGCEWLFSSDGKAALRLETLSATVKAISDQMVKKRQARAGFQLRDIRRTCETMLADLGVSKDVRAQLLSHGLSGIQDKHYDRHTYMREKANALTAWERRLAEIKAAAAIPSNVADLQAARTRRASA
ncbi:DUF4102 domain-containing protein [Betaproteobacteria bacterium PRO7]|nr:DUF4102 domain-containing protein [Betaproteobacteria bacterium PRO7]